MFLVDCIHVNCDRTLYGHTDSQLASQVIDHVRAAHGENVPAGQAVRYVDEHVDTEEPDVFIIR